MENENTQKELFEFEPPKKAGRPRFGQFLQRVDFGIMLTAERLAFLSIGVVMLAVISFALGVERGKSLSAKSDAPAAFVQQAAPAQAQVPAKPQAAPVLQNKTVAASSANITPKEKAVPVSQESAASKDKPYMIVAAAFVKQEFASKEVSQLKSKGLDAFVYFSDPYYLACVGSFANKDSAQKILGKVRQLHKDAYVRLR